VVVKCCRALILIAQLLRLLPDCSRLSHAAVSHAPLYDGLDCALLATPMRLRRPPMLSAPAAAPMMSWPARHICVV